MRKAIKRIAMLFMVCGLAVSVSFGYYMFEDEEANYQKLKAEMEEVESNEYWDGTKVTCSWGEDGEVVIGGRGRRDIFAKGWCGLKNVLAFVDEYRKFDEKELEKKLKKFNKNARVSGYDVFDELKQMPRFKNDMDSGIYYHRNLSQLLEKALEKWKETKLRWDMFRHDTKGME